MEDLILPTTYEEIRSFLESSGEGYIAKIMEFVRPVEEAERSLADIISQLSSTAGKAVFLYGPPGTGKSTFIESLRWRTHLGVKTIENVNCSDFDPDCMLDDLLRALQQIGGQARKMRENRVVALNYLENLHGFEPDDVRAFFRSLNGILRTSPIFIIWPVTDEEDAQKMLRFASGVSGTVFVSGAEIINFLGPERESFSSIAKNTIAVLNGGNTAEEFGLTDAELEGALREADGTIRSYLNQVYSVWKKESGFLAKITEKIPKPTEVWAVFAYPDAESVVSQFARRSETPEDSWTAFHNKLWEYILNSQRAADWTPKRLQLAIGGALKTRVLYLPANTLASAVAAYAPSVANAVKLDEVDLPVRWSKKSAAQEYIKSTLIYRLLVGDRLPPGKRKGGPAADAAKKAEPAFTRLSKYTAGNGADRNLNHAIAEALRDTLPAGFKVSAEKSHPWIPNITPDITIITSDDRIVCLEFCYTARKDPHVIADYVLKKLDRYMRQLDFHLGDTK